jgi:hypothetical protein
MAGTNGTANGHQPEQLVGRVLRVNEKGLRLKGRDGWLDYSKWGEIPTPPSRGSVVALTLDGQGFIRRMGPAETPCIVQGVSGTSKDTTITRLAVLKAAAEFAASRAEIKSNDVLAIAAAWEKWVLRKEGS